jgi:hypothetical protein
MNLIFPTADKPLDVVIDRTKWQRGTGSGRFLDTQTGCRCALGFAYKAMGFENDILACCKVPSQLAEYAEAEVPGASYSTSTGEKFLDGFDATMLMKMNDDETICPDHDQYREQALIGFGRKLHLNFKFVN